MQDYSDFIIVRASAQPSAHSNVPSVKWFGLIESKLRTFIARIEVSFQESHNLTAARIWPEPVTKKDEKGIIRLSNIWDQS